jgi:hypothetical protein
VSGQHHVHVVTSLRRKHDATILNLHRRFQPAFDTTGAILREKLAHRSIQKGVKNLDTVMGPGPT